MTHSVENGAGWTATISKARIGWNIMVRRFDLAVWPYRALTRGGAESKARRAISREITKRAKRERAEAERRRRYDEAEKWTIYAPGKGDGE